MEGSFFKLKKMENSKSFKLKLTKQCAKCPFKKTTNPYEIPFGYSVKKHKNLSCTIANELNNNLTGTLKAMACHLSSDENLYCVGWLHNQLGVGNNILLRLKMINCTNIGEIEIVGEQHEKFEDTLPKN